VPTIETSIDIDAPVHRVWAELTDFSTDRSWDPFFARLDGAPVPGEHLTVTITPPGGRGMTFRPRVLVADGWTLAWLGRLWVPGLFDGRHEFRLSERPGGVHLVHREIFRGVLTHLTGYASTRAGFESFNVALKDRCEKTGGCRPGEQHLRPVASDAPLAER
jgi:hypothetical protein